MKRAVIALVLALAALALLVSLALESRSLPVETHVAQYTIAGDLDRLDADFRVLADTLRASWAEQQAPGEGARALLDRIAAEPRTLPAPLLELKGSASQEARLANSLETFRTAVDQALTLGRELIDDETQYAAAVAFLRASGASVIQELRAAGLERTATDASVQAGELERLLVTLGRDQRVDTLPSSVGALRDAVTTVITGKPRIESKLTQLLGGSLATYAEGLRAAARDLYTTSVTRIDQARLMLAVYSVVMLLAVGFIAVRLHASYRDVNRANADLAILNESLEQRVAQRTQELSSTLSDLKESQVQLVQAEKMSSLGQLVAGISHEINTPLLYLANNAELIRERLEPLRDFIAGCSAAFSIKHEQFPDRTSYQTAFVSALKDVKTQLRDQELDAAVEEIQDLTRDSIAGLAELTEMAQSLKDFSRLDRAPIASFDVNAGLDKTLLIAKNIVKHKATVTKHYGDVPEIECSPSQINQVFLNIITNAAQAIEDQGEIVITTKRHDATRVAISISDTGCGIPEENLSKIRDPFFTTKEVGTGTGLGLSIVDEIVRSHNGEILIESVVGKGSTFTILLPIKRPQSSSTVAHVEHDEPVPLAEAV
jgi:signal transduction histidine kinase